MRALTFCVYGKPATQGSKRAIPATREDPDGVRRPVMRENGLPIFNMVDDNPRLRSWRADVSSTAREQMDVEFGRDFVPIKTAVMLSMVFYRPRPKGHYGTGRNADKLKDSAPAYPTTKPDTLKLARAIEDALSGVVYHDDAQIVSHSIEKRWGASYQVMIQVEWEDPSHGV